MIKLADGLEMPIEAVTEAFAFLARRGAGKTYGAMRLAEGMHAAGGRIAVIDPVGRWWGLRLAADGHSPGIQIPILGGFHGDIPLTDGSGALVADLITDRQCSVILDIRRMSNAAKRRFVLAFISRIYERQADNDSPVPIHIFFEEAQKFAPQRAMKGSERLLGSIEELCREGRNFGIGYTLISQRPQAVNKEVLNLVECLFALQTTGAHERKAIKEWMDAHGLEAGDLFRDLPTLQVGEAIVWSPGWLRVMERVRILERWTYDSSATPKVGAKPSKHGTLAPVDLEALQSAMTEAAEEAEANDPAKLKARIRELERKLTSAKPEVERVEVPVLSGEDRQKLVRLAESLLQGYRGMQEDFLTMADMLTAVRESLQERQAPVPPQPGIQKSAPALPYSDRPAMASITGGARRMLEALARNQGRTLNWQQVAVLSGLKSTSGTFGTYKSRLRSAGYVEENGGGVIITGDGLGFIGGDWEPMAPGEVVEQWRSTLTGGAVRMLDALREASPGFLNRLELASQAGLEPSSGTFGTYLSRLRGTGLIEEDGSEFRLNPEYL